MGRETKILLGLLGMLAFVFLGALLARLFVPRPPVGLGVDVHSNVAVSGPEAIVDPPELGRPGRSAFSAANTPAGTDSEPAAFVAEESGPVEDPPSTAAAGPIPAAEPAGEPSAVVPAAFEQPAEIPQPRRPAAVREVRQGAGYTVEEGDAWWSLAEAAYGDGRWYRGLYAWNRAIDPAVSLSPGTKLVVPTAAELAAAYPGLVPARGSPGPGR